MPEPRKITIKDITKDDLDATYPRVTAKIVDDNNKELTLTIFKKKAKEQDDGTTTPEIIPQKGHSYMGFFKKPKEGFHMGSFNIAWEVHSEPTEDTQETIKEESALESTQGINEISERPGGAIVLTDPPQTIPDQKTPPPTPPEPENDTIDLFTLTETANLRLRVAEIVAQLCNRYSEKTKMNEFIKMCQELETKYVTGK